MGKKYKIQIIFSVYIICAALQANAQISPFNKISISDTNNAEYTFMVSGHFHGNSANASTFPAASLLANIDSINKLNYAFIISLGDLFIDINENYIRNYDKSLFSKLNAPLFNSVGNHDLANGNIYEKIYGKTYFSFQKGSELFIVLNTELNDGSINDAQLEFLTGLIKTNNNLIKNIFIFTHRPVWAERITKYQHLFKGNTRTEVGKNNFLEDIMPLFKNVKGQKNIYWLSGSMAGGSSSFFYDYNKEFEIAFIQTAIRDVPRDAALKVNVKDGKISFKGISFTGQKIKPIESYGVEYWSDKKNAEEESFNYRLLPYLLKQMLKHNYFWIGLFTGILILSGYRLIRKKIAKA